MRMIHLFQIFVYLVFSFTLACSSKKKSGDEGKDGAADSSLELELDDSPMDYSGLKLAISSKDESAVQGAAAKLLARRKNDLKTLNALALFHFKAGRNGMAKTLLQRGFKHHPKSSILYNNFGVILYSEKKLAEAILAFKKAKSLSRGPTQASKNLGTLYATFRDFDKAEPLLEEAVELEPDNLKLKNNYALSLSKTRKKGEARGIFEELGKKESNAEISFSHAVLLLEEGKIADSKKLLADVQKMKGNRRLRRKVRKVEKRISKLSKSSKKKTGTKKPTRTIGAEQ